MVQLVKIVIQIAILVLDQIVINANLALQEGIDLYFFFFYYYFNLIYIANYF